MKSELYWLAQDQILYWKLAGQISAPELCEMSQFIAQQAAHSEARKIHLIIDGCHIQELDYHNQEALAAFQHLANHIRVGKVVAITRNLNIQFQLNTLSRAFGMNWRNAHTLDGAIRSLKQSDNTLQLVPNKPPTEPLLKDAG